jgi:RNAse (barnase) inhibitor barstar
MKFDQLVRQGGTFRLRHAPESAHLQSRADKAGVKLRTFSVEKATDKEKFLRSMAISLSLPEHFGDNWDAFYDCLTDLELAQGGELWLIDGMDGWARHDPEELAAAVSVFSDAAEFWRDQNQSLAVLLVIQHAALASDLAAIEID